MRSVRQKERIKKRRRTRRRLTLLILSVFLCVGLFYGVTMFTDIRSMFAGADDGDHGKIDKKEPLTVLLLGVDEREDDAGRADTIILATVNPETRTTKMLSVPRDTYVTYSGYDHTGKINETYNRGGLQVTIDTVSDWAGLPIDYYAKINMEGLQDLIDAVGGVEVDNPFAWSDKGWDYPAGRIHLEGKRAVWYVRMRKLDPDGDFGRQKRQQMVIQALAAKLTSPSMLFKLPDVLNSLSSNVESNVPFSRAVGLAKNYLPASETVDQVKVEGVDERVDGLWMFLPDPASQAMALQQLKDNLLPPPTEEVVE
ncbi:MAG: LCP family protein [Bacilli bacterium]